MSPPENHPSRRELLRLMGGAAAMGLLGCGADLASGRARDATGPAPDASSDDAASSGDAAALDDATASTRDAVEPDAGPATAEVAQTEDASASDWAAGGTAAMTAKATYPDPHAGSPVDCALFVRTTTGPCTTARQRDREDLSEGRPGLPVRLSLRVMAPDCAPRSGVTVRVWHTTREGSYTGQTPNNAFCVLDPSLAESDAGRGFRVTGADGVATFDTCFPGWYPGRAIHLHFELLEGDRTTGVSQLFFPEDVTHDIFASHPEYATLGQPDTTLATDGVLRGLAEDDLARLMLTVARMPDGAMLASKTVFVA
jgi:protocatechuate 3,4-dioxygenase beta subunit